MILARGSILSGQFWREVWIDIVTLIDRFFMNIVANLFRVADAFYGVFATLAGATDIFDESIYGRITSGLYAIFGVAVLFILAYNFLLIIIDPDKSSGELSVGKTLLQIAVTLLIIVLLPPIFRIANAITGSIIEQNSIPQIIFGTGDIGQNCISEDDIEERLKCYEDYYGQEGNSSMCDDETDKDLKLQCYDQQSIMTGKNSKVSPMNYVLIDIFSFFYFPDENVSDKNGNGMLDNGDVFLHTVDRNNGPYAPDWVKCPPHSTVSYSTGETGCTLQSVVTAAKRDGKYTYLFAFASNYHHNSDTEHVDGIDFHFFLGVVSAVYIIYILVLFSFDLAVRVIKIGFYQIVAPLCVACRIMPGPKKEIFKKWKSLTIKEYCLVFIRVFALCLGIFIISVLGTLIRRVSYPGYCGGFCKLMVRLFLVLGILTFVKQMPKVIDDLLGGDTGLTSTVRDKLKEAAAGAKSLAAAPLGAAAAGAAGVKGAKRGWDRFKKKIADNKKAKKELDRAKKGLAYAEGIKDPKKKEEALAKANARYNKAKKANSRARRSMVSSFAGIGAGTLSSIGRSASRSIGLSDAISDVSKDFKNARLNAEGSAQAAMSAAKRREGRVRNFQDWMDKHEEYKKAGGRKAYNERQKALEQATKELENATKEIADVAKEKIDEATRKLSAHKDKTQAEIALHQAGVDGAKFDMDKAKVKMDGATAKLDAANQKVSASMEKQERIRLEQIQLNDEEADLTERLEKTTNPEDREHLQERLNVVRSEAVRKSFEYLDANRATIQAQEEAAAAKTSQEAAASEYQAAVSTWTHADAAATQYKIDAKREETALQAEIDRLVEQQQTDIDAARVRLNIDELENQFKEISNLREASADANLVVKTLVSNISGSGAAAIETETKIIKILDEVDKDVLESFREMYNKHGRQMTVDLDSVVDAADKVFGSGSQAADVLKRLSKLPSGAPVSKEDYVKMIDSLQHSMSDVEFGEKLKSYGITDIDDCSGLRDAIRTKGTAYTDKQDKNEANKFYDEMMEYDHTGRAEGVFATILTDDKTLGTTEFAGALTAVKEKSKTYSAMDPRLSGASSSELKDAHDDRQRSLDENKQANSTSAAADRMRGVVSGKDDNK